MQMNTTNWVKDKYENAHKKKFKLILIQNSSKKCQKFLRLQFLF